MTVLLFLSFKITNKSQTIDFTENKWFKYKVIANLISCNKFKYLKDRMGVQFYENMVK